ncbi:WD40 repeat domain-containing protein [Spirosoma utsteinense]|uniref:WD40 repeat protein n=1 Tax=Spirosoma utsteinense TaxID=2585773 RepID=A0ABR6W3Y3_9BACT|nr:WD40 repeat domain-containing protein [Spirosoma utsteinense]MBC3784360.1 WD40 repeat protein [Spirosoma utsteinense]MBC3790841.1 WD40 repeat protein [Spirosoma utsteinense]
MHVQKLDTFGGHRDSVYTLERGTQPDQFFSTGGDGLVVRWQLSRPDMGELVAQVPASVYALALHPVSGQLWVGQNYEGLHLIDPVQKRETGSLKLTSATIFDIAFHKNDAFVALSDGVVVVLDAVQLVVRKHLKASDQSARCLAINPVERELAVGYSDTTVRIFDLETYGLKRTIPAHTNSVFTVQYSPDYQFLLTAGRDAHLKVWDVEQQYSLHQDIAAHLFAINHLTFSPDGDLFATASMDKSVKIWDAKTYRLLKVVDRARHAGHGTSVNKLLWTDYQHQLLSASDDRTISVWKLS